MQNIKRQLFSESKNQLKVTKSIYQNSDKMTQNQKNKEKHSLNHNKKLQLSNAKLSSNSSILKGQSNIPNFEKGWNSIQKLQFYEKNISQVDIDTFSQYNSQQIQQSQQYEEAPKDCLQKNQIKGMEKINKKLFSYI
ncbi:hypothetical protein ABPG74_017399 [Tetrahymena malaccensis]